MIVKDLALPASPGEVYDEVAGDFIPIDMLINNAGMIVYGEFSETELNRELQTIQVNLISLTLLTKLYLRDMLKRGQREGPQSRLHGLIRAQPAERGVQRNEGLCIEFLGGHR